MRAKNAPFRGKKSKKISSLDPSHIGKGTLPPQIPPLSTRYTRLGPQTKIGTYELDTVIVFLTYNFNDCDHSWLAVNMFCRWNSAYSAFKSKYIKSNIWCRYLVHMGPKFLDPPAPVWNYNHQTCHRDSPSPALASPIKIRSKGQSSGQSSRSPGHKVQKHIEGDWVVSVDYALYQVSSLYSL